MKNSKGVYAKGTHDMGKGGENPAVNPSYNNVTDPAKIAGATKGRALSSGAVRGARKNGEKNRLQTASAVNKKIN